MSGRRLRARLASRMAFKDHFSRQAEEYGLYRPRYPPELAQHVAALAPSRALALDVATGNGQAALDLAAHFELVLASDASAAQLARAQPHPRGLGTTITMAEPVAVPARQAWPPGSLRSMRGGVVEWLSAGDARHRRSREVG